jgi:anti-sigma regulatory factor (Ser/Thr protein kinase)
MTQQHDNGHDDVRPGRSWDLVGAFGPDLGELCRAGVALLPGITGIGLSTGPAPSDRQTHAAAQIRFGSDQTSARLESAQEALGDGPCHDATATRQPVHAADLRDPSWRERWPRFTPVALHAGARAVFALPLHAGGVRHAGAVDMYRNTPGGLRESDQSAAAAFTAAAAELLTLQSSGVDWTSAFDHARLNHTLPSLAGAASAMIRDTFAGLPLARWFDHTSLPALRRQVHTVSTAHGLHVNDSNRFVLAVHEAMSNAVRHGGGHGQLLLWQRAGRLWCEISDHGPGIGTALRSTSAARTRLRCPSGLRLIEQACASMDITTDSTGTRLLLSHHLHQGAHREG